MKRKILQNGDAHLREKSRALTATEMESAAIHRIVRDMKETLSESEDGVALAAPQIGENIRLFIVSEKALEDSSTNGMDTVYINPRIIKKSYAKSILDEGCLSLRNIFGKIKRCDKVVVEACNLDGVKFQRGASGLLAEIFQHEIDHLDGILFIDSARDLVEMSKDGQDGK